MFQSWIDERMKWRPAGFNGLEMIRITASKLWLPDIVLYNKSVTSHPPVHAQIANNSIIAKIRVEQQIKCYSSMCAAYCVDI